MMLANFLSVFILLVTHWTLALSERFFLGDGKGGFIEIADVDAATRYLQKRPDLNVRRQLEAEKPVEGLGLIDFVFRGSRDGESELDLDGEAYYPDVRHDDRFRPYDDEYSNRFDPYDDRYSNRLNPHDDRYSNRFRPSDDRYSNRFRPSDDRIQYDGNVSPYDNDRYGNRLNNNRLNNNRRNNRILPCCQSCHTGDLQCLASCDRLCISGRMCNNAGQGAYAGFCQQECGSEVVSGFANYEYLPLKACEGECAAQVQELCKANMCRDYGCTVKDCAKKAPLTCQIK